MLYTSKNTSKFLSVCYALPNLSFKSSISCYFFPSLNRHSTSHTSAKLDKTLPNCWKIYPCSYWLLRCNLSIASFLKTGLNVQLSRSPSLPAPYPQSHAYLHYPFHTQSSVGTNNNPYLRRCFFISFLTSYIFPPSFFVCILYQFVSCWCGHCKGSNHIFQNLHGHRIKAEDWYIANDALLMKACDK